jgi:3,5-epimerase/4-reductase
VHPQAHLRRPVPALLRRQITRYARVVNITNSNSTLHDLLPLVVAMAEHRKTGVYNFANPGTIGHNEALSLYKEIVNPEFEWANFTLEERAEVTNAERSNCELDATRLMGVVERY